MARVLPPLRKKGPRRTATVRQGNQINANLSWALLLEPGIEELPGPPHQLVFHAGKEGVGTGRLDPRAGSRPAPFTAAHRLARLSRAQSARTHATANASSRFARKRRRQGCPESVEGTPGTRRKTGTRMNRHDAKKAVVALQRRALLSVHCNSSIRLDSLRRAQVPFQR